MNKMTACLLIAGAIAALAARKALAEESRIESLQSNLERILVPGLLTRQSAITLEEYWFFMKFIDLPGVEWATCLNAKGEVRLHRESSFIGKPYESIPDANAVPPEMVRIAMASRTPSESRSNGSFNFIIPLSSSTRLLGAFLVRINERRMPEIISYVKGFTHPSVARPEPPTYPGITLKIAMAENVDGLPEDHRIAMTLTNNSTSQLSLTNMPLSSQARIRIASHVGEPFTTKFGGKSEFIPIFRREPMPPPIPGRPEVAPTLIDPGNSITDFIVVERFLRAWPEMGAKVALERLKYDELRLKVQWSGVVVSNEIVVGPK